MNVLNNYSEKNNIIYDIILKELNNKPIDISNLQSLILEAKINSINNENYLHEGNAIIEDLENKNNEYNIKILDEYICDVHNKIYNLLKNVSNDNIEIIIMEINKARKMNNRMGLAIDKKNQKINKLLQRC